MAIYQVNVWVCEICGFSDTENTETFPFHDPVVGYELGDKWDYIMIENEQVLVCPTCQAERKNESNAKP